MRGKTKEDNAKLPDCDEGQRALQRFDDMMCKLLSVSHETLTQREEAYQERVQMNPKRRGPKRKVNPSASPGAVA